MLTYNHNSLLCIFISVTDKNHAGNEGKMQQENNTTAIGSGIGVAALVIMIAIIIAVLMVFKRRREKAK